mgnify:CR=1 FL=1
MIFQPKIDIFSVFYTMNLQIHGLNLHVLCTAVTLYHEFTNSWSQSTRASHGSHFIP